MNLSWVIFKCFAKVFDNGCKVLIGLTFWSIVYVLAVSPVLIVNFNTIKIIKIYVLNNSFDLVWRHLSRKWVGCTTHTEKNLGIWIFIFDHTNACFHIFWSFIWKHQAIAIGTLRVKRFLFWIGKGEEDVVNKWSNPTQIEVYWCCGINAS